ncbi:MAG: hypothetical protein NTAFB01_21820 [Nitrospira sp.]
MANNRTKLELTRIGKENRPKLEPRILLEEPEKSYHAPHRVTDRSPVCNMSASSYPAFLKSVVSLWDAGRS